MSIDQAAGDSIAPHAKGCVVSLTVSPRASANRIEIDAAGTVRVKLTAPPVEGAANAALLNLLASVLGVPKHSLTIVAGIQAKQKRVLVDELSAETVRRSLTQVIGRRL